MLSATGCNLYGGLSSPSNDQQYLLAARACLDQGNYQCALDNYNALSNAYHDIKISEIALTELAQGNIFSMKDFIASLGNNSGSGASLAFIANELANRGITSASVRTTIQTIYTNENQINDPNLKAFSQFIAAVAMFNEVLANAVTGSVLTSNNIAAHGAACKTSSNCTTDATNCGAPVGTQFTFNGADHSDISSGTPMTGSATIQKMVIAAAAATAQLEELTGQSSNYAGIISAMQQFSQINVGAATAAADQCSRQLIIQYLDL